jgi:hypothetical protein
VLFSTLRAAYSLTEKPPLSPANAKKICALPVCEVVRGVGQSAAGSSPATTSAPRQLSGRTDERPAEDVFALAGLLTDQHDPGARRAFAEDCLRRRLP